jgi:outer membrane immunogenic protein
MKKFLLSTVALLALLAVAPAQAADMGARAYNKAPVPVAPLYNWSGFYVGGHIGYGWTDSNWGPFGNNNSNNGGFAGGLQAGADWQFAPNWVLGVEGEYSWTDINNGGLLTPLLAGTVNTNGVGSIAGRIGYTWGPGLLYFKGGWGWADRSLTVAAAGVPVVFAGSNTNNNGYTLGGGLEWMFAPNWSAKIEYQFYNFDSQTFLAPAALAGLSVNNDVQTIKLGVNYRFNWGGPVVARY